LGVESRRAQLGELVCVAGTLFAFGLLSSIPDLPKPRGLL
jgi:hypothetical protein